ncbi:hypothetical protein GCM10022215_00620 [Nocardioides fonticola]|uniref:Ferric reductase n=1 Tax=Nocardioides fonticola TaxID=450363 RepID=A0ABP7XB67_9ACTN
MTTDSPVLWYLNRGTGIVLLSLLSLSVLLGVLALTGRPAGDGGSRVPRFVTQNLHRNLALGSVLLLVAHIVTAVADEFVDIRWWQAVVPFGATYAPLWLELGTLAFDLMLVVAVTSLLRHRIGLRSWRIVHLTSWAAYAAAVAHGFGIGTDLRHRDHWEMWSIVPTAFSVTVVVVAFAWRLAGGLRAREDVVRPSAERARIGVEA